MKKISKGIISNQIRKQRFEHDEMTQQQLATLVGITRQTIAAIESGKYSPSLEVAFCLAEIFDISLDELFQWESTPSLEDQS